MLKKTIGPHRNQWDLFVDSIQFAMNRHTHSVNGSTPFEVMFARSANPLSSYVNGVSDKLMTIEELNIRNKQMLEVIYPALHLKTQASNVINDKSFFSQKKPLKSTTREGIRIGSLVYLRDHNVITGKYESKYSGPYRITGIDKHLQNFDLQDIKTLDMKHRISLNHLKFLENPPRDLENDKDIVSTTDDIWNLDKIITHRGKEGAYEYFVSWKGYDETYNTWEPQSSILTPEETQAAKVWQIWSNFECAFHVLSMCSFITKKVIIIMLTCI